jgi:hypothetical protein
VVLAAAVRKASLVVYLLLLLPFSLLSIQTTAVVIAVKHMSVLDQSTALLPINSRTSKFCNNFLKNRQHKILPQIRQNRLLGTCFISSFENFVLK